MKMTALATIRTTKDRADPLQPSVRDAMLAAVPSLRAFAISLSGNVDRADDLVQETLLRAMANIDLLNLERTYPRGSSPSSATCSARNTASVAAKSKTPTAVTSVA